jgi:hypothetical protein
MRAVRGRRRTPAPATPSSPSKHAPRQSPGTPRPSQNLTPRRSTRSRRMSDAGFESLVSQNDDRTAQSPHHTPTLLRAKSRALVAPSPKHVGQSPPTPHNATPSKASSSSIRPSCSVCPGSVDVKTKYIICDFCEAWYHRQCVGRDRGVIPQSWYCPACLVATSHGTGDAASVDLSARVARAQSAPSSIKTLAYSCVVELAAYFDLPLIADRDGMRAALLAHCDTLKVVRCLTSTIRTRFLVYLGAISRSTARQSSASQNCVRIAELACRCT